MEEINNLIKKIQRFDYFKNSHKVGSTCENNFF